MFFYKNFSGHCAECAIHKIIILGGILLIAGCAANKNSSNSRTNSPDAEEVALTELSYHDGILEGQLFNNSKRTAEVIMIEVSFLDSAGKAIFPREFRAVPGGDGHALLPQYAKHFNYNVALNAQSRKIEVSGRIKSVDFE